MYKIVIFGDSSTGKTNFMNKYVKNEVFKERIPTIGVDFDAKLIKSPYNRDIKVHFWDTSGSNKFVNIARSYFASVAGAVLMFDTAKLSSFENLPKWLNDFNMTNKYYNVPIIIIGTNYKKKRVVPYHLCVDFAKKNKVFYDEIDFTDKLPVNKKPNDILQPLWDDIWLKFVLQDNPCMGIRKYVVQCDYNIYNSSMISNTKKNNTIGDKFKNIKKNLGLHIQDITEGCYIS